ncbi:putative membrane protein [Pedobacter sp. UYP30]|uniref:YgaP-like transmembrane domain n=1 Tax=Pedobacter sp. UYP30 TaxID=1756400 RepID=UPI0033952A37
MTNAEINNTVEKIKDAWRNPELYENISDSERILSGVVGSYLLFKGLTNIFRHPIMGAIGAAAGVGLLFRGYTGYCPSVDLIAQSEADEITEKIFVTETYVDNSL